MKILLLGPKRPDIHSYLSSFGDEVLNFDERLLPGAECLNEAEFLVSYGYRFILIPDLLDKFPGRAINLHISLLPWNRGADPNLWSFLDDTPKGVTIHYLDYGLDTGDIIAQQEVIFLPEDTLRTSYEILTVAIETLFTQTWPDIRAGNIKATPQPVGGSFHRLKDRIAFEHLLTRGWDTPVAEVTGKAKEHKRTLPGTPNR